MANMEWPKTECSQRHRVQHTRNQWNVSKFWHRQNVPQTQKCHQQRAHNHRVKPPDLLRLNSVGESVEEFPDPCPKRRQFCARKPKNFSPPQHHQQSNSDFVGKFWNKVREPIRTRQNLTRVEHSPQHIDLDQLADKFSGNFEIDPQKFQASMNPNQEVVGRPVPVVTFDGGPYIKCESKGNTTASTRMFPAYYRFLSFAHFHPYNNNNIVRNRMLTVPPFQQQMRTGTGSSWLEIAQHQVPRKSPCHHTVNGAPLFAHAAKKSYDQYKMKQNKSVVKDRMMQNRNTVSHHYGQHSHRASNTKPADIKLKNCKQKQDAQSSIASVTNKSSIHVANSSRAGSKCNSVSKVVQTTPCENTGDLQSQSGLTDAINSTNTSQDKSTSLQGHVESLHKTNLDCLESDCSCSSADTAKLFELKLDTCNTNDTCEEKETDNNSINIQNAAVHKQRISDKKQMHSTIAYLLGDYMAETPTCSNDSDFSDDDYEDEDLDDTSRELLDSFMPPNNPVYAWKCLSKPDGNAGSDHLNSGLTLTLNDSGTVLEQTSDEATTNSQSDASDSESQLSDESSDSGCDQHEIPDSQNQTSNLYDPMGGLCLETSSPLKVSKGTAVESETRPPQQNDSNKAATVLKLCSVSSQIHPSLSFILGLDCNNRDSPDGSDTEDSIDSEDADQLWDSFESPIDPYNPINGCKFRSSSFNQSVKPPNESVNVLSETDVSHQTPKSSSSPVTKSSSTGCLKKATDNGKERVKKVSFCSKDPIFISPEVGMWEEEYMEARRGHWEEYARDRCRFQRRIRQAEFIISPCLKPEHRAKIGLRLEL